MLTIKIADTLTGVKGISVENKLQKKSLPWNPVLIDRTGLKRSDCLTIRPFFRLQSKLQRKRLE